MGDNGGFGRGRGRKDKVCASGDQPDPVPDPPAQSGQSGQPNAGDGRWRISDPKIRDWQVG